MSIYDTCLQWMQRTALGLTGNVHTYARPRCSSHPCPRCHSGILIDAVTTDAQGKMVVLAFAHAAQTEQREVWEWFIRNLCLAYPALTTHVDPSDAYVVMSDRQKGLQTAVANLLPNVHHFYCKVHL